MARGQSFSVKGYAGDKKALLAFNFNDPADAERLAGFTIRCQPPGRDPYYLWNLLQFEKPAQHHQVAAESPRSSVNAPFQKYRWVHVPGTNHQGVAPAMGDY